MKYIFSENIIEMILECLHVNAMRWKKQIIHQGSYLLDIKFWSWSRNCSWVIASRHTILQFSRFSLTNESLCCFLKSNIDVTSHNQVSQGGYEAMNDLLESEWCSAAQPAPDVRQVDTRRLISLTLSLSSPLCPDGICCTRPPSHYIKVTTMNNDNIEFIETPS